MTVDSNNAKTSQSELFSTILADESEEELFVIRPDEDGIEALVEVLGEMDDPPSTHVLAVGSVLKEIRREFVVASAAAELVEAETLWLRTSDEDLPNSLVVTEETVVSVVSAGTQIAGLVTDDAEFVASVRERWQKEWKNAEEFRLRTPGRSRVENSLSEEFGSGAAGDFRTMVDALATARGEHDAKSEGLDEVGVSLLVTAKHGELLYDISKWGEDVGVASKATFSRTKNELEDAGLLTTEKVPIDVGRPRLRLRLGSEELREASAEEVVSAAQGTLSRMSA